MKFQAVRVFFDGEDYKSKIVKRSIDELPDGEVVIKVEYSSLNYKDALSISGNRGITREYPHTPGIDAVGIVYSSNSSLFKEGQEVIVTGYDLGMNTDGGFGEYIRVPEEWVVEKPKEMDSKVAMIYGTAGFTAGISVYELTREIKPGDGKILVTGACGGVGTHVVRILSKLGYKVVGVVNTSSEREYVLSLGAMNTIDRGEASDTTGKAMLGKKWIGVIDTVGGNSLSAAIRSTDYHGVVTTCGNIAGAKLEDMSVYPFILRGVRLVGITSSNCKRSMRMRVWEKLSRDWLIDNIDMGIEEVGIEEIVDRAQKMLEGNSIGRVVLKYKQ